MKFSPIYSGPCKLVNISGIFCYGAKCTCTSEGKPYAVTVYFETEEKRAEFIEKLK